MTIETKYNIGDEAWFYLLKPIRAEIVAITIRDKYMAYHVQTMDRGHNNFSTALTEEKLFPTEEELLKSL